MANPEHPAKLSIRVKFWNELREKSAYIKINLEGANLKYVNLEGFNLEGLNLKGANLENANLKGVNLKGVNLKGANLKNTDLREAKLVNAIFKGANLENANLTSVQALATNFEGAILTGACIEDWNINSQTNLQNVKCDYVYLKGIYSPVKEKWIYKNRVPHYQGKIFTEKEFTKRYQKIYALPITMEKIAMTVL
ncbi:MAG: pentapeptide repeat-containing protein [Cyanobacteria bacterium P01_F01_bin.143]